jgi:hypothetical protein
MALIAGGAAALLGLVAGGILLLRGSSQAVLTEAPAPVAGFHVISTAAPPLAAPDPEVAATEARDEAERYARLQESLRREGPPAAPERRSAPLLGRRQPVPVLVGSVRPVPPVAQARVAPVAAPREDLVARQPLAQAVQASSAPPAAPVAAVEEAPAFPAAGFQKPAQAVPGCVQRAIRLPRDLAATLTGTYTVRFAVGRDGSAGLIQVMDKVADPRISEAIVSAVQSCGFKPGTDTAGHPMRMWVVMPLRFVGG